MASFLKKKGQIGQNGAPLGNWVNVDPAAAKTTPHQAKKHTPLQKWSSIVSRAAHKASEKGCLAKTTYQGLQADNSIHWL